MKDNNNISQAKIISILIQYAKRIKQENGNTTILLNYIINECSNGMCFAFTTLFLTLGTRFIDLLKFIAILPHEEIRLNDEFELPKEIASLFFLSWNEKEKKYQIPQEKKTIKYWVFMEFVMTALSLAQDNLINQLGKQFPNIKYRSQGAFELDMFISYGRPIPKKDIYKLEQKTFKNFLKKLYSSNEKNTILSIYNKYTPQHNIITLEINNKNKNLILFSSSLKESTNKFNNIDDLIKYLAMPLITFDISYANYKLEQNDFKCFLEKICLNIKENVILSIHNKYPSKQKNIMIVEIDKNKNLTLYDSSLKESTKKFNRIDDLIKHLVMPFVIFDISADFLSNINDNCVINDLHLPMRINNYFSLSSDENGSIIEPPEGLIIKQCSCYDIHDIKSIIDSDDYIKNCGFSNIKKFKHFLEKLHVKLNSLNKKNIILAINISYSFGGHIVVLEMNEHQNLTLYNSNLKKFIKKFNNIDAFTDYLATCPTLFDLSKDHFPIRVYEYCASHALPDIYSYNADYSPSTFTPTTPKIIKANEQQRPIIKQPIEEITPINQLNLAIENCDSLENIDRLIREKNISINTNNESGYAPLHIAAIKNNIQVIELLINKKVEINIQNTRNDTPLHSASFADNFEAVKCLLKNNADPNIKNYKGNTPLHNALATKNNAIASALMAKVKPKTINLKNKFGYTPLHIAVMNDDIDMVQLLLEKNASLMKKNIFGETPIDIAIRNQNLKLVKLLVTKQEELHPKSFDITKIIFLLKNFDLINIFIPWHKELTLAKKKGCSKIQEYLTTQKRHDQQILLSKLSIFSKKKSNNDKDEEKIADLLLI